MLSAPDAKQHELALGEASLRVRSAPQSSGYAGDPLTTVAISVAGPLLFSYCQWIVTEAVNQGIKRLYFLSRDGDILMRIVEKIIQRRSIALDLRYLYVSRTALLLPSIRSADIGEFESVKDTNTSLQGLLQMLQPTSVGLVSNNWPAEDVAIASDLPLRNGGFESFKSLLKSAAFRDGLLERARESRELVSAYFRQEGLMEDVPYALVDVGWKGTIIDYMNRCILDAGISVQDVFFIATSRSDNSHEKTTFYSFLASNYVRRLSRSHTRLIEAFCTGPHGPVSGYDREIDGKVVPRYHEGMPQAFVKWGVPAVRANILRFADSACEASDLECDTSSPKCFDVLDRLVLQPTRKEAITWGDFPFEEIDGGTGVLGPEIRVTDSFRMTKIASAWPAASLGRSSILCRFIQDVIGSYHAWRLRI
jgi:hypothetical protein